MKDSSKFRQSWNWHAIFHSLRSFRTAAVLTVLLSIQAVWALDGPSYVSTQKKPGTFTLCAGGRCAPLVVSAQDHPGVLRVVRHLQTDIGRVTRMEPEIVIDQIPRAGEIVLIGTLGRSPLIDELVESGKIDLDDLSGKWEMFITQIVEKPFPGVGRALVIAGSDKRGTLFGMFDLSKEIGVSPWVWWADVPVVHRPDLYVIPGRHTLGEPAVRYRGIFLNDEEPCLGRWAVANYGGFTHGFYEKVFVLLLRLKGNHLWPAMWWASFNSDDTLNPKLADEYGIVMGTSHHEPMMRAHAEWRPFGGGAWNYETNAEKLREFWTEGIRRMGTRESIVTLAMRGDGDLAMTDETNIELLERIVADQREILAGVTGKDITTIPQVWALYKEVQDYYDEGMRVPDDVTLLLCDDNWGNVRRLPRHDDPPRSGGYGMYYHYDFVGGPRSYKWLNTNPIARIWEQMHLSYRHGVDRIWIVNVGDLKPMEYPISFFLDYAWNPDAWPAERLPEYASLWARQQFGSAHEEEIAEILTRYTMYNSRRKPEMLEPGTYSLIHYREAETVVDDYNRLMTKAENTDALMPPEYRDAYFQLVLYPVQACANLNDLYVTVAKNRLYAQQGRAATGDMAKRAKDLFDRDAELSYDYNRIMSDGKWNHMMDQTRIGYTYWQQPDENVMPEVKKITVPGIAEMGVAIEGSKDWWPAAGGEAVLPESDPFNKQRFYIEVFNRGTVPFEYRTEAGAPWLTVTPGEGRVEQELRIWVNVDWDEAPRGRHRVPIRIQGPDGSRVTVYAAIHNPDVPRPGEVSGFVEDNGVVSMEAEHFTRAVETPAVRWLRIPDLGRTLSGMTPMPVTARAQTPGGDSPRLEYRMHLFGAGEVEVHAYFSPTQNYLDTEGLRYAVSFDDLPLRIINVHVHDTIPDWKYPRTWNEAVGRNIKIMTSIHRIETPGEHVLKFWMVDPGLVLQKIVVDAGGLKPSYLGPPESYRGTVRAGR